MNEPTFTDIWQVLELNQQFLPNVYGPKGEECLTKEEKRTICALALKKLKSCYDQNGPEFFSELWPSYRQSLATMNWYGRNPKGDMWGPYVLLAVAYRKSSKIALSAISKRQPKPIYEVVNQVVKESFI